jgi:hypothetical protein
MFIYKINNLSLLLWSLREWMLCAAWVSFPTAPTGQLFDFVVDLKQSLSVVTLQEIMYIQQASAFYPWRPPGLHIVLYAYEIWYRSVRKEHRQRVIAKIFGPERE